MTGPATPTPPSPSASPPPSPSVDPFPPFAGNGVPLRVLSYNIHGQRDDRAALAATVRALAPDVVLVQEAPRRFRWRQKTADLAESFGMFVAAGGLPGLGNLLVTTLRVRVGRTWYQRYPLTPGRHLRGAVFAECTVPGAAPFVLAGTHLATDPAERPGQAALFKREVADLTTPVIVGLDVNETPDGAAWRTVADGLVDPAANGGGTVPDGLFTFPCRDPRRRIDAVFVDPQIMVVSHEVVDTPLTRRASDHFPILVDLLLPPA